MTAVLFLIPYVFMLFCLFLSQERVKKSNERSGAVSGVQKIKWSVSGAGGRRSGNGAVSGTPVNGAER